MILVGVKARDVVSAVVICVIQGILRLHLWLPYKANSLGQVSYFQLALVSWQDTGELLLPFLLVLNSLELCLEITDAIMKRVLAVRTVIITEIQQWLSLLLLCWDTLSVIVHTSLILLLAPAHWIYYGVLRLASIAVRINSQSLDLRAHLSMACMSSNFLHRELISNEFFKRIKILLLTVTFDIYVRRQVDKLIDRVVIKHAFVHDNVVNARWRGFLLKDYPVLRNVSPLVHSQLALLNPLVK